MTNDKMMQIGDFKKLNLKRRYTSLDDTLNEFFIPVLKNSKYYYRASGYFSSNVLVAAAKGLSYFIEYGEKMYLITGVILSSEDVEAINKGLKTPPEIIEKVLLRELEKLSFEDVVSRKRLEVLAWLVAKGKLEIKVAIPVDETSNEVISRDKIWHSKFAIFEDFHGNKIHIEGSINETAQGWTKNIESFSVHRSWDFSEKEYIESAEQEFWATWNNKNPKVRTYDIPEAVKRRIIRIAPKELGDLKDPEEGVDLWPHQLEAIKAWYKHGKKGIISMATGTGKTYTALFAIKNLSENPFVVLLVPSLELARQWNNAIKKVFGENIPIFECSSQNSNWKSYIEDYIMAHRNKEIKKFILATISSALDEVFVNTISNLEDYVLVVDEVHRIGAKKSRKILKVLDPKAGRLGLSATPKRLWDTEGTKKILDYFGGIIYEYSLSDAIKDGIVVPYEYHIEIVNLTKDELYEYFDLTKEIHNLYNIIISKYDLPDNITIKEILETLEGIPEINKLHNLILKRTKIIKKAVNKIPKTLEIIEKNKDKLGRCLIYCEDTNQLNDLANEMLRRGYRFLKYLGIHDKNVREDHLRLFEDGVVNFLLSIRCLDEGVDIPACDSAIILASSTNPREFIQRRGRVLRKSPGKCKAIIYDLFVFPYDEDYNFEVSPVEIEIYERELTRSFIFLQDAVDSEDTLIKINRLNRKLKFLGGTKNEF